MAPKSKGRKPTRRGPQRPARPVMANVGPTRLDGTPLLVPPAGVLYSQLQSHPRLSRVRLLVGMLVVVSAYLFLLSVVAQLILRATYLVMQPGIDFGAYRSESMAGERPEGLLATNLAIASFAVVCALVLRYHLGLRVGWLSSVTGRLRWGFVASCAGITVVTFGLVQAVILISGGAEFSPQPQFLAFLLVVVATSPLQAAAEEIYFRGYLLQAFGSLANNPWVGVAASSLLFALAHGTQSPALFVDRLAFGVLAALLVLRTGGLEAAIGIHIVNNVMAFVLAGLTSTIAQARQITEVGWDRAALDVGMFTVTALVCWLVARRSQLAIRTH